jgi:hypothetical protein
MTCVHLRELYSLCQAHDLKITSSDLVRIVCPQCGVVDTCPSILSQDYDRPPGTGEPASAGQEAVRPAEAK